MSGARRDRGAPWRETHPQTSSSSRESHRHRQASTRRTTSAPTSQAGTRTRSQTRLFPGSSALPCSRAASGADGRTLPPGQWGKACRLRKRAPPSPSSRLATIPRRSQRASQVRPSLSAERHWRASPKGTRVRRRRATSRRQCAISKGRSCRSGPQGDTRPSPSRDTPAPAASPSETGS